MAAGVGLKSCFAAEAGSATESARGNQLPEVSGWGERRPETASKITSWIEPVS